MKIIKNLVICFLSIIAITACTDDEVSYAFKDVSAPSNVAAVFDISNDDTGTVTLTPTAEGVTSFQVYFGDLEDETPTDVAPGEAAS
ncbi:MAG: PKD domain protein, partial [Cellulophaga baltica]